jgi:biotin carboxylase
MLAYRAMRCCAATGADVVVVGNVDSKGFKYSRFPEKFILSSVQFNGSQDRRIADELNRIIKQERIDIVIAGDAPATRSIIGLKCDLDAPVFPYPNLETFDLLNDKWRFTQLCRELGIRCPPSKLFETRMSFMRAISGSERSYPRVAKPLSLDGGHGVVFFEGTGDLERNVNYEPVLLQDYIPGRDIGASIYCRGGQIRAHVVHELRRAIYRTYFCPAVVLALEKIASQLELDGVYNFDMRSHPDGTVYFLECNPRLFYKMNLSMLAGINFVEQGLGGASIKKPTPAALARKVRVPKAFVAALATPWQLRGRDFQALWYFLSDPISSFRQATYMDWEP